MHSTCLHADAEMLSQKGADVVRDIRTNFIIERDGAHREAEGCQRSVQILINKAFSALIATNNHHSSRSYTTLGLTPACNRATDSQE